MPGDCRNFFANLLQLRQRIIAWASGPRAFRHDGAGSTLLINSHPGPCMNLARNVHWNRLLNHHAKILTALLIVGYSCSAAHAQMLDEYSDDSLYRSPLKQALGQKHHPRSPVDPYMALIERDDPYYLLRSGSARSALGSTDALAGTTLPDLAAGWSGLSSRLGLTGKSLVDSAGQLMNAGGSSSTAAKLRQNIGSNGLALPGQTRQPGQ